MCNLCLCFTGNWIKFFFKYKFKRIISHIHLFKFKIFSKIVRIEENSDYDIFKLIDNYEHIATSVIEFGEENELKT